MAPLLSLSLFAFFWLIGFSLLQLIGSRRNLLRNALLAPSVGASTLVLPLFTLFRLNYAVRRFALALTILLAVGAAIVIWRRHPLLPVRHIRPFLIVLAVAFLLTGYPLFLYGFNWISFGNDDMAGYVLSAHHFTEHGLYDLPDERGLLENRDAGANYWFSYAIEGARCGSDLLLAWVISLTGLTGYQIYMPVMLALHMGLISSLGALIVRNRRFRVAAVACCAWLAVSPLNTLGTMYQLMPQVFGVMLLIGVGVVLLKPLRLSTTRQSIRLGLLAGVLLTGLVVVYYEITPFLALTFAAYHALQLLRKQETVKAVITATATATFVLAISIRTWALSAALFLRFQATRSLNSQDIGVSLFPYYLVPSGLANLWGLVPIGASYSGVALDLGIAGGGMLLLAGAVASAWQAWKGEPAAMFSIIMLVIGARLFAGNGDYGLFKLAMYIQPFLLSSVVLAWFQLSNRWTRELPHQNTIH